MQEGRDKFQQCLQGDEFNKDMIALMDLYNRGGFSEGYGRSYHGKSMMSMVRPNHSGLLVGEVIASEKGYANIRFDQDINAQDILEIRNNKNEQEYEFTMKDNKSKDEGFKAKVGYLKLSIGNLVYRTRNNMLLSQLQDKYLKKDNKIPIKGRLIARTGEKLQLFLQVNNQLVTVYHNVVEPAIKQPMTKEKLQASIDKLGDSMFCFQELSIEADSNVFVPVSWLNEIRREAVLALSDKISESYRRTRDDLGQDVLAADDSRGINKTSKDFRINVAVQTREQFDIALSYKEISAVYIDYDMFSLQQIIEISKLAAEKGKELYTQLPHICRLEIYEKLDKDISALLNEDSIDGFIVKNFEEIELLNRLYKSSGMQKNIRLNHNMYIFNKYAKGFWHNKGINDFIAPIELNKKELYQLGLGDCEMIVYGYLPLMVSVQCLYASTEGCSKCKAGENRFDYLLDRIGKKFFVRTNCSSCYNVIYNGQRLSLLGQTDAIKKLQSNGIRLDFTYEATDEMKTVVEAFIGEYVYGRKEMLEFDNITAGHFKRGVD